MEMKDFGKVEFKMPETIPKPIIINSTHTFPALLMRPLIIDGVMQWDTNPETIWINVDEVPFTKGGMREVLKRKW